MLRARIVATLETADHDGDCSEDECEYQVETVSYEMVAPSEYESYPEGRLIDFDEHEIDWVDLLPEPTLHNGSCYCELSGDCVDHELDRHEYRYTIVSVELFRPEKPSECMHWAPL